VEYAPTVYFVYETTTSHWVILMDVNNKCHWKFFLTSGFTFNLLYTFSWFELKEISTISLFYGVLILNLHSFCSKLKDAVGLKSKESKCLKLICVTRAKVQKQSRCHNTNGWINKIWYLYTVEFIQLKRRMKFCYLQVNEWHWRTSSYVKLKRFRRQKATYSLICGM
jgi:hypothetical protein